MTVQPLRRIFATLMQRKGSVKDVQAQLRHAHTATLGVYTQAIPDSVTVAAKALDLELAKMNQGLMQ